MCRIGIAVWVLLVIAFAGLPAGVQAQSDEGLVAEWHFDEGSGSVLADSSGNGNDGVIYGTTWVEGKYGKALSFDGKDDYINIGYPGSFFSTSKSYTDVSVEIWIKPNVVNEKQVIYQIGGSRDALAIGILEDGTVRFALQKSDSWKHIENTNVLTSGSWYYVVCINGEGGYKLYLNGELAASSPYKFTWNTGSNGHTIGGVYKRRSNLNDVSSATQMFNGVIDEVRIHNKELTAEEIKSYYKKASLSITKTASPSSIKQGQTATITLTVKNTGSTEISDIEIADTIPDDLIFIDGETSKIYASLTPQDSRQFQYVVQIDDAGTFNLEQAVASYADEKGNYKTVKSKPASIDVIPSLVTNTEQSSSKKSNSNVQSASVNLHGEKTDVVLGEDVLLKLSAVNIIGNPTMHVQVIIIPPSGWSVTSSEFAKSGAGQYTTTYELESGSGKDIEVRIVPNQIGDEFQVEGRIIYYFGDDVETREDHTLSLPIKVRAQSDAKSIEISSESDEPSTPGFAAVVAVIGLLLAYVRRRA